MNQQLTDSNGNDAINTGRGGNFAKFEIYFELQNGKKYFEICQTLKNDELEELILNQKKKSASQITDEFAEKIRVGLFSSASFFCAGMLKSNFTQWHNPSSFQRCFKANNYKARMKS